MIQMYANECMVVSDSFMCVANLLFYTEQGLLIRLRIYKFFNSIGEEKGLSGNKK